MVSVYTSGLFGRILSVYTSILADIIGLHGLFGSSLHLDTGAYYRFTPRYWLILSVCTVCLGVVSAFLSCLFSSCLAGCHGDCPSPGVTAATAVIGCPPAEGGAAELGAALCCWYNLLSTSSLHKPAKSKIIYMYIYVYITIDIYILYTSGPYI